MSRARPSTFELATPIIAALEAQDPHAYSEALWAARLKLAKRFRKKLLSGADAPHFLAGVLIGEAAHIEATIVALQADAQRRRKAAADMIAGTTAAKTSPNFPWRYTVATGTLITTVRVREEDGSVTIHRDDGGAT